MPSCACPSSFSNWPPTCHSLRSRRTKYLWSWAGMSHLDWVSASVSPDLRRNVALGLSSRYALPVLGDGSARLGLLGILQSFVLEVQREFLLFETWFGLICVSILWLLESALLVRDILWLFIIVINSQSSLWQRRRGGHLLVVFKVQEVVIVVEHEVKCFHVLDTFRKVQNNIILNGNR